MTTKCTMIITTYNKPRLLKRILSYYDQCNLQNKIIVADTSSENNKKLNKDIIDSCPNLDIFYLTEFKTINEYPGASGQFVKLADATEHVEDKYCVTCADDDFITPKGIEKSVEFLEKNPDYVVAQGQYLSFKISDDSFHWNYSPKMDSNTHSDAESRLLQHFSNYTLTIYSVHKTEIMNLIWKETTRTKNLGVFGELTASMLTPIYGKMKGLDVFYNFRETDFTSHGRTAKKLYDYVSEGTYDEKYSRLKNCLSQNLSKEANITIKEAEKIVDKGWAEHTKRYKGFVSSKVSYIMKNILLSSKFDQDLKKVYKKFRKNKSSPPQTWNTGEPTAKYLDDFKIIKKHILDNLKEKKSLETITV